jgi:hypothetical protein
MVKLQSIINALTEYNHLQDPLYTKTLRPSILHRRRRHLYSLCISILKQLAPTVIIVIIDGYRYESTQQEKWRNELAMMIGFMHLLLRCYEGGRFTPEFILHDGRQFAHGDLLLDPMGWYYIKEDKRVTIEL